MSIPTTFAAYVNAAAEAAGSDVALGLAIGYTDGARVGMAKRGQGARFSELAVIRLARHQGDDPLTVLRLAGYQEMADLLDGYVMPPRMAKARQGLIQLKQLIDLAVAQVGIGEETNGKEETADGHQETPRRMGSQLDRKRRKDKVQAAAR